MWFSGWQGGGRVISEGNIVEIHHSAQNGPSRFVVYWLPRQGMEGHPQLEILILTFMLGVAVAFAIPATHGFNLERGLRGECALRSRGRLTSFRPVQLKSERNLQRYFLPPSALYQCINFELGVNAPRSCAVIDASNQTYTQTVDYNPIDTSNGNIHSVSFSDILNNAIIFTSVGSILDFTSGNSNVGSRVVSSDNPSVVSVINSSQVKANTAGRAVVTVNLYQSSGNGQTGSPTPHYVTINVR